jgi:hypothetical protein
MTTIGEVQEVREELDTILVDVLSSVLSEECYPVSDPLPRPPLACARLAVHDQLDDTYGVVEVSFGLALAEAIAARMMRTPDPTADDIVDAVAELGNIAAGSVKTLLCLHARLSLPSSEITQDPPPWTLHPDAHVVHVRAEVIGHVAELAVIVGADPTGLLWPPADSDELIGRTA